MVNVCCRMTVCISIMSLPPTGTCDETMSELAKKKKKRVGGEADLPKQFKDENWKSK